MGINKKKNLYYEANTAKDPQKAEQLYRKVLQLSPYHFKAMRRLADTYMKTSRIEQVLETLESCADLDRDPRPSHVRRRMKTW